MAMPAPSEGHRRLKKLAGIWEGVETMYPSKWDPEGGSAIGRSRNRVAVGGFALITDYEQERGGVITFTGHGVYTWDPKADRVSLHWFDSMGSPPELFTGRFEGGVLTLSHGGPGMHARLTRDLREEGVMRGSMEMSRDGRTWRTLFEAEYRRVSAPESS